MDKTTEQIAESFQCTYTIFRRGTDPDALEQAYMRALEAGKSAGFYPAILVVDEYVQEWLEIMHKDGYDRTGIIAGCREDGKEILDGRFSQYTEDLLEDFGEEELAELIGAESEGDELHHFIGYRSFSDGSLAADALLLEIPVKEPWEVIGYLPMGGWNECPAPEEMIAVCRYWYERYKAVPAVFTHDVMEFYAPLKLNGADASEAAREHYAFCIDRVDQGTRTGQISELAAGLADSTVWYFWWD